ncbi:hypothetical protein DNTS_033220 [Danionella cerebrum]|uniref:Nicotinate phosphoribosyltransferase n=1 Tax=Danionella cerebrum TaxID=2873325 RepID=A0A553R5Z9_9TELE|nr:hypothetical protein DNTS_033220 [Danionella translucida]
MNGNMATLEGDAALELSVRHRVPPLLTDLYQFSMAYAYWRAGRHAEPAVFELFFRENPFGGAFSLFAGLSDCLMFLKNFSFSEDDVEYLRSVLPANTDPKFFCYLKELDCSGVSVSAVPEGSVVFARVPLLEVSGPLAVVQLLETSLLCLVNYASLVCSNAARFRVAAGSRRRLMEMGLRRAQGPDGGLSASRYAYIGGFDLSSNALAGRLFGIPVAGTMAHSYVTSFSSLEEVWPQTLVPNGGGAPVDLIALSKLWLSRVLKLLSSSLNQIREGELASFLSYAIAYPHNFLPVIDSYSVSGSGVLCFCAVALSLTELLYAPLGVRLDSGDLCRQSLEVRKAFRECSKHFSVPQFESLIIVGTNSISEQSLAELNKKDNEIDVVGVGTHLVTCTRQPSLGCVYKLVEVRGRGRMKLSEDPEKSTLPGRKAVYRLLDSHGHPQLDLLCLWEEAAPVAGVPLKCFPLTENSSVQSMTPAQVTSLRSEVFLCGKISSPLSSASESRERAQASLQTLNSHHRRLQEPVQYTSGYTPWSLTSQRETAPIATSSSPIEAMGKHGTRPKRMTDRQVDSHTGELMMSDSGSDEDFTQDTGSTESVRKGCDPLVSTQRSKLQQRRAKLNQKINRELLLRTGAENLYRASSNQKVKETVALELSFVNSNLQLLKEELEELNSKTRDLDLSVPLQEFISEHYGEEPSLYRSEIQEFMELRQAMRTPSRNDAGPELLMEYFNQLYFLEQRFFSPHRSLGLHFHWYDSLTGVPSVQRALAFEKGSVLFNIGALYTQIGARQDRSTLSGIENAIDAFQRAAGAFLYLRENFSHAPSLDMSGPALSMLVRLMVAQVQECVCEKLILSSQENKLKVLLQAAQEAARVSDVYSLVLQAMSVPLLKDYVPFSWISMVQVKTHHFRALAHYHTAAALCDCSGFQDKDNEEGDIKALIQIHTREPEKLNLHDPEDKRRLGKAHLRKAIIRHEEALRLHGICKMLRKMDLLQEVLAHTHSRSLEKYSEMDQEDDFCELAEAPDIQSHTQQKPDIRAPDFSVVRVTDIFHRLGPLSVFSARNRWIRRSVCLIRGEAGLGLTLRGDSPVLVAGVLPGGCAAEAGLRDGDYIVSVNGVDCRWAEHAEVVHALKSCSEQAIELHVITLQMHQTERRLNLSPGATEQQQCSRVPEQNPHRPSSLWSWSWRTTGVSRRTLSSSRSFPESQAMY